MTRNEAIDLLARRDLARLSYEQREALLLGRWSIDSNDPECDDLPEALKAAIAHASEPNGYAELYDPLLLIALRHSYTGVLNSYLRAAVATLGHEEAVDGEVEVLEVCRCCGYRSLRERDAYEICHVCFWEDDGTTDADRISSPNHMTLRDARLNILRFGAVTEKARQHVLPDGRERYALGDLHPEVSGSHGRLN